MKQLNRLHNIKRKQIYPNQRPKDAASLLILDLDKPENPRVLMGRRHPKQEFIPDMMVFPGGRVSSADSRIGVHRDLDEIDQKNVLYDMKGRSSAGRARGIALAAIRETFEETGVIIGRETASAGKTRSPEWCQYLEAGIIPDLSCLTFIGRAITPPNSSRRYDTRFFVTTKREIAKTVGNGDGEFTETYWMPVKDAEKYDLHPMSRNILDDAMARIDVQTGAVCPGHTPYYFMRNGVFQRLNISP